MKKVLACIVLYLFFALICSMSVIPEVGFLMAYVAGLITVAILAVGIFIILKLLSIIFS